LPFRFLHAKGVNAHADKAVNALKVTAAITVTVNIQSGKTLKAKRIC
jgi:hypothetical protein